MTARVEIKDGTGSGAVAQVSSATNALLVQQLPESGRGVPAGDLSSLRQLRSYFTDASGSNAQNVDGSTTPVEFSILAEPSITKWVTGFRLILEGTNLEIATNDFRRYGNATTAGTPLTNGVEIEAVQSGVTTAIAAEPVGDIGDYLQWADDFVALTNAVSSQSDYLHFDFTFDRPVVLTEGTLDALTIRINDDLTPIDKHIAVARGYQEFV